MVQTLYLGPYFMEKAKAEKPPILPGENSDTAEESVCVYLCLLYSNSKNSKAQPLC